MSAIWALSNPYILEKIFDYCPYDAVKQMYLSGVSSISRAIDRTLVECEDVGNIIGVPKHARIYAGKVGGSCGNSAEFSEKLSKFGETLRSIEVSSPEIESNCKTISSKLVDLPNLCYYREKGNNNSYLIDLPSTVTSARYSTLYAPLACDLSSNLVKIYVKKMRYDSSRDINTVLDFSSFSELKELTLGSRPTLTTRITDKMGFIKIVIPSSLRKLVAECSLDALMRHSTRENILKLEHLEVEQFKFYPSFSDVRDDAGDFVYGMDFSCVYDSRNKKAWEVIEIFYDRSSFVQSSMYTNSMKRNLQLKHRVTIYDDENSLKLLNCVRDVKHLICSDHYPEFIPPSVIKLDVGDLVIGMNLSNVKWFSCLGVINLKPSKSTLLSEVQAFVVALPLRRMDYISLYESSIELDFEYDGKRKSLRTNGSIRVDREILANIRHIDTNSLKMCRDMKNLLSITINNDSPDPMCALLDKFPDLREFVGPNYIVVSSPASIRRIKAVKVMCPVNDECQML